MLREVFIEMFQYASSIRGYCTTDMQLNRIFINLEYELI